MLKPEVKEVRELLRLFSLIYDRLSNKYYDKKKNQKIIASVYKKIFGNKCRLTGEQTDIFLIKRAYAQHLCQNKQLSILRNLLRATIALCAFFPFIIYALLKNLPQHLMEAPEKVLILYYKDHERFIKGIFSESSTLIIRNHGSILLFEDILFILAIIKKYPRSLLDFEFLLKTVRAVSKYSYIIKLYNPKEIIDFQEHSSAASLLTMYCRKYGIIHSNLMHGHRAYTADLSFLVFDHFYVWSEYYQQLFTSLHAVPNQFIITGNPFYWDLCKIRNTGNEEKRHQVLLCFEPLMESGSIYFNIILKLLEQLDKEWEIVFRLRYTRQAESSNGKKFVDNITSSLNKIGRRIIIENAVDVEIHTSIARSNLVIAIYTNALEEAWVAGKKTIAIRSRKHTFVVPDLPYISSPNVLIMDETTSKEEIDDFLSRPIVIDDQERQLLKYIANVDVS